MLREATGEATTSGALDELMQLAVREGPSPLSRSPTSSMRRSSRSNTQATTLSVAMNDLSIQTVILLYNPIIHMSTIRVSDDTKELLERRKRENETFDELLARLATAGKEMNAGAWSSEKADAARKRLKESRASFERDR